MWTQVESSFNSISIWIKWHTLTSFSIFPYSLSLAVKKCYSTVPFFVVHIEQHRREKRVYQVPIQSLYLTELFIMFNITKLMAVKVKRFKSLEDKNAFHYYFSKVKEIFVSVMLTLQKCWCFIVVWEKKWWLYSIWPLKQGL